MPHPEYEQKLRQIHGKCGETGKIVADLWRKPFTNQTFALNFCINLVLTLDRQARDMKPFLVPIAFALTACGAQPAPEFFAAQRADVTRDGRPYTVFYTENRVEVIRQGYAKRGDHSAIRAAMIALIPEVTGCKLVESTLRGDSGEMRGSIRC